MLKAPVLITNVEHSFEELEAYKLVTSCWVNARFQMPMSSILPLKKPVSPDQFLPI